MHFRAYNLCDPGPDRDKEIQILKYAFKIIKMEMKKASREKIGVNPLLFHMSKEFQRNFAGILQNKM